MLKGIPKTLTPDLLKILCEMGHDDRIVIADGNFPAESIGKKSRVIRFDGVGVPEILEALLKVIPLDTYVKQPMQLMRPEPQDEQYPPIWEKFEEILNKYDERGKEAIGHLERFAFYEEAGKAYAIIASGEEAVYANIILRKGVVTPDMLG